MNLSDRFWFQLLERCWRPLQQWGFAIAAVAYGFRPVFDASFQVETFAALAAAGGVGFVARGIEKVSRAHVERV
ncbi:MAG: hypothetical protein ABJC88_16990 [Parasphingorhabdus sp.]|uniref:hypothetical protein n=1 Tax=Sphingomonadales TaxID=204457 RepID=UPI0032640B51